MLGMDRTRSALWNGTRVPAAGADPSPCSPVMGFGRSSRTKLMFLRAASPIAFSSCRGIYKSESQRPEYRTQGRRYHAPFRSSDGDSYQSKTPASQTGRGVAVVADIFAILAACNVVLRRVQAANIY